MSSRKVDWFVPIFHVVRLVLGTILTLAMFLPVIAIGALLTNHVPPIRYLIGAIGGVVGDTGMFWLFLFCCWVSGMVAVYGISALIARSNRRFDRTA